MIYFKGFGEIANHSCNEAIAFARELGLEPVNTEVAAAIRPRKVREEA